MYRCVGLVLIWAVVAVAVAQESSAPPTPLVVVCCQGELEHAERLRQVAEQGATIEILRSVAHQEGFELIEYEEKHCALSRSLLVTPATVEADLLECLILMNGSVSGADCNIAKSFVSLALQRLISFPELMQTIVSEVGLNASGWLEQAQWNVRLGGRLTASRDAFGAIFVGECDYTPDESLRARLQREKRPNDELRKDSVPWVPCKDYHILYTTAITQSLRTIWARAALNLVERREVQEQQRLNRLIAQLQSLYRTNLAGQTLKFEEVPPEVQQQIEASLEINDEQDRIQARSAVYNFFVTPEVVIQFSYSGKSWLFHLYLLPNMPADQRPIAIGLARK